MASGGGAERGAGGETSLAEVQRRAEEEALSTYFQEQGPVGAAEGASYSLVIVAGLGVAAVAGYAVFKELVLEPTEYRAFNAALERVRGDPRVTVRLGSSITGYGQEGRGRGARQRIPNQVYRDEEGREHCRVQFQARGPAGSGTVHADCFEEGGEVQFEYLVVDVRSGPMPSRVVVVQPGSQAASAPKAAQF